MPLTPPLLHVAIHPPLPRIPPLPALVVELLHLFLLRLRQHCHVIGTHAWSPVEASHRTFAVVLSAWLVVISRRAVSDGEGAVFAAYPAVFEDVAHDIVR